MNIEYRRATADQIELLVKTRVEVLRAANRLDDSADLSEVAAQSRDYYLRALRDNTHTGFLAFDGDAFVGAGGVSYFRVMPTCHNVTGWKAYIMNMYVRPEYRRRGIAAGMLDLLVADARARGIGCISLEATDAGRPLYEKYGFIPMTCEMELP
ncbi:MAG: GNAT family N-acetyltransferase [Clostridia bacterium]|nr:GNAT family N-acetyltransferase [Clostridia bacterium]